MMHLQDKDSHESLVDWLRRHDPGDAAPLDAAERTRLRNRMLASLDQRPAWIGRWWAWGGATLAALTVALIVGRLVVSADRPRQAESKPVATSEAQSAVEPRQFTREVTVPESTPSAATEALTHKRRVAAGSPQGTSRAGSPVPSPGPPAGRAQRQPRRAVELRFVAPEGTRIIWALDPELDLAATRLTKEGS